MAIHHLTEDDFPEDALVCTPENMRRAVWSGQVLDILVAHNCAFERQFVTEAVTDGIPWICTYKVALHVWPDAPRHTNRFCATGAPPNSTVCSQCLPIERVRMPG
jgi:exodeoxyribonuclease X